MASTLPDGGLNQSFESVVVAPQQSSDAAKQAEEVCEDMNKFLKKAASVLAKFGGTSVASSQLRKNVAPAAPHAEASVSQPKAASATPSSTGTRAPDLTGSSRPSVRPQGEKSGDATTPGAPGATGDKPDMAKKDLANFFQNLLTRNSSVPGAPGGPTSPGTGAPGARASMMKGISRANTGNLGSGTPTSRPSMPKHATTQRDLGSTAAANPVAPAAAPPPAPAKAAATPPAAQSGSADKPST